jgi:hypothetical protein
MDIYLASDIAYSRRDIGVQDKILMFPIKKVDLLFLLLAGAFFYGAARSNGSAERHPETTGGQDGEIPLLPVTTVL